VNAFHVVLGQPLPKPFYTQISR